MSACLSVSDQATAGFLNSQHEKSTVRTKIIFRLPKSAIVKRPWGIDTLNLMECS